MDSMIIPMMPMTIVSMITERTLPISDTKIALVVQFAGLIVTKIFRNE